VADILQLEENTDRYLLEDGTGGFLLEAQYVTLGQGVEREQGELNVYDVNDEGRGTTIGHYNPQNGSLAVETTVRRESGPASLKGTVTGAGTLWVPGDVGWSGFSGIPVTPGDIIEGDGWGLAGQAGSRSFHVVLRWGSPGPTYDSQEDGGFVAFSTSAWTRATVGPTVVPPGVDRLWPQFETDGGAAAEIFYFEGIRAWRRPVVPSINVTLGQGTETETGRTITPSIPGGAQNIPLVFGVETETGHPVVPSKTVTVGQAVETETGLVIVGSKTVPVVFGTETETGQPMVPSKIVAVAFGTETETGQPVVPSKFVALGQGVEIEIGLPITAAGQQIIALGQALETETGLSLVPSKTVTVGQATETETGRVITVSKVVLVGQGVEVETGLVIVASLSGGGPGAKIVYLILDDQYRSRYTLEQMHRHLLREEHHYTAGGYPVRFEIEEE
jgi:hypothetical protein